MSPRHAPTSSPIRRLSGRYLAALGGACLVMAFAGASVEGAFANSKKEAKEAQKEAKRAAKAASKAGGSSPAGKTTPFGVDAMKVQAEQAAACAPDTPENYQIHTGTGSHPDAGVAKQTAESQARFRAIQQLCSGKSATRCAVIQRHLESWKTPYWNPLTNESCAHVGVHRKWLQDDAGDLQQLQLNLAQLASRIVDSAGSKMVAIDPPIWTQSGCTPGEVGAALTVELKNALARQGKIQLAEPTHTSALRLRVELTPTPGRVLLGATLRDPARQGFTPMPGFDFAEDLFVTGAMSQACAGDDKLGLKDGYREGANGLVARLELGTESSLFCEGTVVRPRVVVNKPSQVKVFSVAQDGRALLVWPPPGERGLVEKSVNLGEFTLYRNKDAGDEKLITVAVPIASTFTHMDGWTGFCQLPTPFSDSVFPPGAAGAAATYHVMPFDAVECMRDGRDPFPPPPIPPLPTCPTTL